jgi:type I restriction enzyme M protein
MLGAIIGDIVGSRFEFDNHKSKDFELFAKGCYVTDDSIMTLAVAKAILSCDGDWERLGENAVKYMQIVGRKYPGCGFGGMFRKWVFDDNPKPYNSFGNGAAMRVSPCGFIAQSEEVRSILPNSLKTEIVVTMNLREWRHFYKLRTANKAHPQMREITIPMLRQFKEEVPIIFDDIEPNK